MVKVCEQVLNQFNTIAPHLKWDDNNADDLFARDILGARLRAKFYGAQVITYRDFVLKILQCSHEKSIAQDKQNSNSAATVPAPASSVDAEVEPIIILYAKQCIKALVKSTIAFHGVGSIGNDRLMVTNIWGSAHAYVLSIALRLPIL